MYKLMIICGVLGAIVVYLLFGFIRGQQQAAIRVASLGIGRQFINSTNSSRLVQVGPDLHTQLASLLSATTSISTVLFGDEPRPIGDGRACCRLVLTNTVGQGLLIRLRRDPGTDSFRVLGFRSISQ